VKQHLAAIRTLFDWLVTGPDRVHEPGRSVRAPKYVVKRRQNAVLRGDQARLLLDPINIDSVVGLRDRAIIGLKCYTFARVSAIIHIRVGPLAGVEHDPAQTVRKVLFQHTNLKPTFKKGRCH
jgi:site-specific recombinase XerC